MRIITGALAFFESRAGMAIDTAPPPLLPNPPPVYSQISTTSSGLIPTHRATASTVRTTLWVEQWRCSLPFCQNAMALRVSMGWWPVEGTTNVSSSTRSARVNSASRSP